MSLRRTVPVKRLILAPAGSPNSADRWLLNPDASAGRSGPVTRSGRGSVPELTWGSKFMVRAVPVSGDQSAKVLFVKERQASRPFAVAVCRCDGIKLTAGFIVVNTGG